MTMDNQDQQSGTAPQESPAKENRFTSTTISKVVTALARAQGKYKQLSKNCVGKVSYQARDGRPGGSYEFRYADLGAVIEATSEALSSEELAHVALIGAGRLRVMLLHSSGEFLASEAPLPSPEEVGPQKFGSQVTYLRRYLLAPLIGVASEDDDDGNGVEGNRFSKTERPKAPPPVEPKPAGGPPMFPKTAPEKPIPVSALLARLAVLKIAGKEAVLDWLTKNVGHKVVATKDLKPAELEKLQKLADESQPPQEAKK